MHSNDSNNRKEYNILHMGHNMALDCVNLPLAIEPQPLSRNILLQYWRTFLSHVSVRVYCTYIRAYPHTKRGGSEIINSVLISNAVLSQCRDCKEWLWYVLAGLGAAIDRLISIDYSLVTGSQKYKSQSWHLLTFSGKCVWTKEHGRNGYLLSLSPSLSAQA
jgi:hypothetical protein